MSRKSTFKRRASNLTKRVDGFVFLEPLETRRLLSAGPTTIAPLLSMSPDASAGPVIYGYSPVQISAAYGFNLITSNGANALGAGQTIAIVDAYNDPNIASDLAVFDGQFGLSAPPSLQVVSQTGSSTALPGNNAGWDTEIALDVEWAHAMAPGANILLVEAKSASTSDLLTAVQYAASVKGVSVVSMSWGGSEFSGENSDNSYFSAPGVTYVGASGDEGSAYGPEWPSSSAYVLSVGGTTLNFNSSSATYSETGWSGSTGGASLYEGRPEYQNGVQSSNARTSPDVAYDANPNTGVAVYDSVPDQGYVGWEEFGGTSVGAPQWAALIAIADQGRAAAQLGSLSGSTQTLPDLYALYNPSTTYASSFNDITSGSSSRNISAAKGYDEVTGLGSPKANAIVQALIADGNSSVALTTATISSGGGGHGRFGGFNTRGNGALDSAAGISPRNNSSPRAVNPSPASAIFAARQEIKSAASAKASSPAAPTDSIENASGIFSTIAHRPVHFNTPVADVGAVTVDIVTGGFSPDAASPNGTARTPLDTESDAMLSISNAVTTATANFALDPSNPLKQAAVLLGSAIIVGMYVIKDIKRKQAAAVDNGDFPFGLQRVVV